MLVAATPSPPRVTQRRRRAARQRSTGHNYSSRARPLRRCNTREPCPRPGAVVRRGAPVAEPRRIDADCYSLLRLRAVPGRMHDRANLFGAECSRLLRHQGGYCASRCPWPTVPAARRGCAAQRKAAAEMRRSWSGSQLPLSERTGQRSRGNSPSPRLPSPLSAALDKSQGRTVRSTDSAVLCVSPARS